MSRAAAFRAISVAIIKGFLRDRTSVFFAVIFPLMFLVLFGGLLGDQGLYKVELIMAIGLLAGAVTTTVEGAVNAANFVVLPMAFLSGSFFPLDSAPSWLRAISQALPLKHLNEAMLDVMVRGEGPGSALAPMGILAAFAVVVTLVAARLFRWETS